MHTCALPGVGVNKQAFLEGYLKDRDIQKTRRILKKALSRLEEGDYDVPLKSGLNRVFIPKDLDPTILEKLDYFKSRMAVPERGQKEWTTFRNLWDNTHLHKHKEGWYMHKDEYPSLQTVFKRLKRSKNKKSAELYTKLKALFEGSRHAVQEGIPGYQSYIEGVAGNTPDFEEIKKMGKGDYLLSLLLSAAAD